MTRPPLLPRRGASREDAQEAHQRLGTEAMASDWSRRIADVADRGLGRLKWAESAPPRGVSGRTGVRAKTAFPLRARNSLHRPKRPFRCAVPAARSPPRAVSSVSDRVRFHLVGDIVGLTNCQCHDRQRWVLPGLFSSQWRRGSWRMRLRSRAARQRAFRMFEPPAARIRL